MAKKTKEYYLEEIKKLFIFKPIIKEINLSNTNKFANFNCYICKFKIRENDFKFTINHTNKSNQYIIMFYNSFTNNHKPRHIHSEDVCEKFIYSNLLNLFTERFNKAFIDFNEINFL